MELLLLLVPLVIMAATVLALLLVLQPWQVTTTTILSSAGAPAPEESQERATRWNSPRYQTRCPSCQMRQMCQVGDVMWCDGRRTQMH